MAVVEQLPGAGSLSHEQYRALPRRKPIDICMDAWGIVIEVDGSQHSASSTGFGQEAGAQHERDRQLDRSVLSSRHRLVRLHHQDAASWGRHMLAAMRRVQQQPDSSFVYYSASYPESSRVQPAPP